MFRRFLSPVLAALALVALGSAHAPPTVDRLALTGQANAVFSGQQTQSIAGLTATFPGAVNASVRYSNGDGANQVETLYMKTDTIAASAADTIDLRGVVTDPFGAVVNFSSVKAMIVSAAAGNTNDVLVGGQASGAPTVGVGDDSDVLVARPGGWVGFGLPGTGFSVAAGTDSLRVANSGAGTPVIYTIMMLGTSP